MITLNHFIFEMNSLFQAGNDLELMILLPHLRSAGAAGVYHSPCLIFMRGLGSNPGYHPY